MLIVKQKEGVGHKELVEESETTLHGHAGGKLTVFMSKPTPSAEYLGRRIIVRSSVGVESKIYVCALNDADEYDWYRLGGPATVG